MLPLGYIHKQERLSSVLWTFHCIRKDRYSDLQLNLSHLPLPSVCPFSMNIMVVSFRHQVRNLGSSSLFLLHVPSANQPYLFHFSATSQIYHLIFEHSSSISSGHPHFLFGFLQQPVKFIPKPPNIILDPFFVHTEARVISLQYGASHGTPMLKVFQSLPAVDSIP